MDGTKKLILGVSVAVLLLAAGGIVWLKQQGKDAADMNSERTEDAVAKVNGEEINSAEIVAAQEMISQQGEEISEENALEQVINQKIISQEVENEGYSITTEEAEATIGEQLSAQGMGLEEYKQQVEQEGVSYEEQLQRIKEELAVQKYLSDNIDEEAIAVTEEESEQFYERYQDQETEEEIPPYEEIKPQITARLEQQKQQEAINSLIQELRQDADIEYL